jgi:hypothetical protein
MPNPTGSILRRQAIDELRSLIADLDGRIERQRRRVQRALVSGGPHKADSPETAAVNDMRSLLEMMIGNRSVAQEKLSALEAEPG